MHGYCVSQRFYAPLQSYRYIIHRPSPYSHTDTLYTSHALTRIPIYYILTILLVIPIHYTPAMPLHPYQYIIHWPSSYTHTKYTTHWPSYTHTNTLYTGRTLTTIPNILPVPLQPYQIWYTLAVPLQPYQIYYTLATSLQLT